MCIRDRLSDEKEQIEAHADLSQYTEEEMENLLINHTFMGAEHSNVGDTVILFLKTNEGSICLLYTSRCV